MSGQQAHTRQQTASTLSAQFSVSTISNDQQALLSSNMEHVDEHPFNDNLKVSVTFRGERFVDTVSGKIRKNQSMLRSRRFLGME
jgi:hypothetical protein